MRAAWKPAQNVFRADDGHGEALECTIYRGAEHQAFVVYQVSARSDEARLITDVLDHFHVEHDVEGFPFFCQGFRRGLAIVHHHAAFLCMSAGRADVLPGRVDTRHIGAHFCQIFRNESATAPDVENAHAFQGVPLTRIKTEMSRYVITNVLQTDRIESMQNGKLSIRSPPFRSKSGKLGNFRCIYRRCLCTIVRLLGSFIRSHLVASRS